MKINVKRNTFTWVSLVVFKREEDICSWFKEELFDRRFWKMTYKWVYDLNEKKLYKTKKESTEINHSEDDLLDISYSDKRVISRFYTLERDNDYRLNLNKGLLFINNLDSTLTRIILRRKRFWN